MSAKKTHRVMAVGAPSLIMIFVVLCLACFAALTLSSANAEARLAQKAAESTANYYAADTRLQEKLAQLDAVLASCGKDSDEFAKEAAALGGEWNEEKTALILMETVGGNTQITAVFAFDGGRYELIEYRTGLIEEPEYNTNFLNLWGGE